MQRTLCDNCLVPILSSGFIYDNGASLAKKGYSFSINRFDKHLDDYIRRNGTEGYILLFDFSKFFDNVNHELIKGILAKKITDKRILNLVFHFIDMFGEKGLGLGSQISQVLALASGNPLDHLCKEKLRIKYYGRYMDDGYLIHKDKEYLKYCLEEIEKMCNELGIVLNRKKTQIVKLTHGFCWLKRRYRIYPGGKRITLMCKTSSRRQRHKMKKLAKKYAEGLITSRDFYNSFCSWTGYAKRFTSYRSRQRIKKLYNELMFPEGVLCNALC